ncbi:carbamate kinase [Inediibacterium massiliense]|uniref:carbamate kinase n=1 Tax=Inediibacterium massiliense TaxID=1658111 RepID=UPI0006B61C23|nr:carbamate kinase [Inediibacterium massiliense]
MSETVVVALGGNAILRPNQEASFENQLKNIETSCNFIANIIVNGYKVVITHGNGPQVGNILRQNEEAKKFVPAFPLDVCSAQSQGLIGYMMERSLKNALTRLNYSSQVVTLLTQTEVDSKDKAFENPSKPIGLFYSKEEAEKMRKEKNWIMKEDSNRGYRRVVPSPKPKKIHGIESIKQLLESNITVISTGGGGIPIIQKENGEYAGIEAVIDKDLSALRLCEQIDADVLMILTDVTNVYLSYGTPNQKKLESSYCDEAEKYLMQGHFSDGSMGPKMEAAISFAKKGKKSIICSLEEAVEALEGKKGTRILSS